MESEKKAQVASPERSATPSDGNHKDEEDEEERGAKYKRCETPPTEEDDDNEGSPGAAVVVDAIRMDVEDAATSADPMEREGKEEDDEEEGRRGVRTPSFVVGGIILTSSLPFARDFSSIDAPGRRSEEEGEEEEDRVVLFPSLRNAVGEGGGGGGGGGAGRGKSRPERAATTLSICIVADDG